MLTLLKQNDKFHTLFTSNFGVVNNFVFPSEAAGQKYHLRSY